MSKELDKAKELVEQQLKQQAKDKPPEGKYEYEIKWNDGSTERFTSNYNPQYNGNVMIIRGLDDKDTILITLNMRWIRTLRFPATAEGSKIITPDGRDANAPTILTGN